MLTHKTQGLITAALNAVQSETPQVYNTQKLTSTVAAKNICQLHLAGLDIECFDVLMLDAQHRVLTYVRMSEGTISSASVYPREVVKAVLQHNAAAVILTHNHPSGELKPSEADKQITQRLKEALATIDVSVLDHIIVGNTGTYAFAEYGEL